MVIIKRTGWVLVGMVIGVIVSGSLVAARWVQGQPRVGRLVIVSNSKLAEGVVGDFIKDTRTGACWLSIRSRDDTSAALASAPTESGQP